MAQRTNIVGAIGRFIAEDVPDWVRRMNPARGFRTRYNIGSAVLVGLNTPEDALKIAAVWRCCSIVSQSFAMLPWQVFRKKANGDGERQATNPTEWLLSHRANAEQSAFEFRRTMKLNALLWGNAYAEIQRDTANRPYALWILDPARVTPGRNSTGDLVYKVRNNDGTEVILASSEVYHLRGLSKDGVVGYSVLEVAAGSLTTALALDDSLQRFFARGFRPMGFLKTKGKLSLTGLDAIEKKIEEYSKPSNRWKALPLDQDMDFQPLAVTPEDAQIIDMRKFNVIDICRWFGVPPHLCFDLDRATFSNIESQGQEFLTYGLSPHIIEAEQETDFKLLGNGHGGLYSKINVNAIVRADMGVRQAFYTAMLNAGVFTINMVLRLEEQPTIGPDGDEHVRQVQFQPIGTPLPAAPVKAPANDPNANDNPPADTPPAPPAKK